MRASRRETFKPDRAPSAQKLYWPAAVGWTGVLMAAAGRGDRPWDDFATALMTIVVSFPHAFCAGLVTAWYSAARKPLPILLNFGPLVAFVILVWVV